MIGLTTMVNMVITSPRTFARGAGSLRIFGFVAAFFFGAAEIGSGLRFFDGFGAGMLVLRYIESAIQTSADALHRKRCWEKLRQLTF